MRNSKKILTGLSHEMRSYLNAIVGFSYIIEGTRQQIDPEFSGRIFSTCNQLIWLIDNFLNTSMIDIGESDLKFRKYSLKQFSSFVNTELNDMLRQVSSKDIILEIEGNCHGDHELIVDMQKIIHILRALFMNSINSMDNGIIRLGCYYNGIELKIYLTDTGQDFEKCSEFLNSINIDDSLSKYYDTTSAINIILSKKLVELIGGRIHIRPNNPGGTEYIVSIPAGINCYRTSDNKQKSFCQVFKGFNLSTINA